MHQNGANLEQCFTKGNKWGTTRGQSTPAVLFIFKDFIGVRRQMPGFDSMWLVVLDGLTWQNDGKSVLMFSFSYFHGLITAQCTTETVIRYNHVRQAQVETESESRSESSTSEAETLCIWPWSHAEGLRLAAAAKLPPLLICRRATIQSHGER